MGNNELWRLSKGMVPESLAVFWGIPRGFYLPQTSPASTSHWRDDLICLLKQVEIHLGRDFYFVLYLVEILLLDPFSLLANNPAKEGSGGCVVVDKIKLQWERQLNIRRAVWFPWEFFFFCLEVLGRKKSSREEKSVEHKFHSLFWLEPCYEFS